MRDVQAEADVDRALWHLQFSIWRQDGKVVVGYGAPAKATVWLNWVGVTARDMTYVVDSTKTKQGRYIPGTDIEIRDRVGGNPDVILILANNYRDEIAEKLEPHPPGTELWCIFPPYRIS